MLPLFKYITKKLKIYYLKYMKIKILLLILFILININIFIKPLKIVVFWKNNHVNSLIGFQKYIEKLNFNSYFNIDLWFDIILPILSIPILLFISICCFILFVIFNFKK